MSKVLVTLIYKNEYIGSDMVPIFWDYFSMNNRLGVLLAVPNKSSHHVMQFKSISGGAEGR